MTVLLLILALGAGLNPLRAASVAPRERLARRRAVALATAGVFGVAVTLAWWADPLLDWLSVTGSSARIAAGVALVITSLRDVFSPAAEPEPALRGAAAGLVPLAFPTMLTPAVALLAIAAGQDRGVAVTAAALATALAVTAATAICLGPNRAGPRWTATVGLAGVALGALVTLDGVYAV